MDSRNTRNTRNSRKNNKRKRSSSKSQSSPTDKQPHKKQAMLEKLPYDVIGRILNELEETDLNTLNNTLGYYINNVSPEDYNAILKRIFNYPIQTLNSLLLDYSSRGYDNILDVLLTKGANVNAVNPQYFNITALHIASERGNVNAIERLLRAPGVNVNIKDNRGYSPLHLAAMNDQGESIRTLITFPNIDINIEDREENTALHTAAFYNKAISIRSLLTARGINVNKKNRDRKTPLHLATYNNRVDSIRALLTARGINLNKKDADGNTPLYYIARNCNEDGIKLLLDHGADINEPCNTGIIPLQGVILNDETSERIQIKCMELLLARGANINHQDKGGWTALHFAAEMCNPYILQFLVKKPGIILDLQTKNSKKTPLQYIQDKLTYQNMSRCQKCFRILSNPPGSSVKEDSIGGATHTNYKGRNYKIQSGQAGGRYILVGADKKKIYLK